MTQGVLLTSLGVRNTLKALSYGLQSWRPEQPTGMTERGRKQCTPPNALEAKSVPTPAVGQYEHGMQSSPNPIDRASALRL